MDALAFDSRRFDVVSASTTIYAQSKMPAASDNRSWSPRFIARTNRDAVSRSKSLPQQSADFEEQLEGGISATGQQVRKQCIGNAQFTRNLPLVAMLSLAKGA